MAARGGIDLRMEGDEVVEQGVRMRVRCCYSEARTTHHTSLAQSSTFTMLCDGKCSTRITPPKSMIARGETALESRTYIFEVLTIS